MAESASGATPPTEKLPPLPKRTPRPPPEIGSPSGSGNGWSSLFSPGEPRAPVPPPFTAPGAAGPTGATFPLTSRRPPPGDTVLSPFQTRVGPEVPADPRVPPWRPSTTLPPVQAAADEPATGTPEPPAAPAPVDDSPDGPTVVLGPIPPAVAAPPPAASPAPDTRPGPPGADRSNGTDRPNGTGGPNGSAATRPEPDAPPAEAAPEPDRPAPPPVASARSVEAPARYEEDPTEVLGPFDVGQWTQDGDATGPVRGRRGPARRSRRDHSASADHADHGNGHDSRNGHDHGHDHGHGGTRRDGEPRVTAAVIEAARARASSRAGERPGAAPAGQGSGSTRPPASRGDRIRTAARGIGQTLITLGVVVLLFVVYEVWITDLMNARTQKQLGSTLAEEWEQGDDPVVGGPQGPQRPGEKVSRIPLGKGFANIYIPVFGLDYVYTIVEGTDPNELDLGPGHYVNSVLPGQVGNFALAGHRVGKGSPFLNLDKLRAGDAIVIETKDHWYTYRVLGNRSTGDASRPGAAGVPGMEIVSPTEVDVIRPVPGNPTAKAKFPFITLTTCHPKFSARQRLIIHGQLEGGAWPKSRGDPPALGRR